ncbi:MAG: cytochrome c [Saprospiraceae bacterium]|nr:cytochrome c [Saprospiraceae bacterium]
MKKIVVFTAFIFIVFSCAEKNNKAAAILGKQVFKKNCVICHGVDGKLGLNNSKDLTISKLTKEERVSIIKNGKGAMNAFGTILKPQEIDAVVEYTFLLK